MIIIRIDIYSNNDNNNIDNNENNININDYNNNNFFFNNNDIDNNYIEFNKINIILKSNYGHRKYIGLTGIIFIDEKNEKIDIEKAKTIGALPKDLRTEYNDDSDNRIFENVFNGINNTNDADNMWVTKLKKKEKPPYMKLIFEEKIKLSKIIIYNYNQKDKSSDKENITYIHHIGDIIRIHHGFYSPKKKRNVYLMYARKVN